METTRRGFLTGSLAAALLAVPGVEAAAVVQDAYGEIPDGAMEGVYRGCPWQLIHTPSGSGGTIDPYAEYRSFGWKARLPEPVGKLGNYMIIRDGPDTPEPELVRVIQENMLRTIDRYLSVGGGHA